MHSSGAGDSDLIQRAAAADVAALEQLLLTHHDRLLRLIRRNLPLDMDRVVSPEDVLQETFVDAFRYMGTLQARDEAGFTAWLNTIARNRVANARKKFRALKRGKGKAALPLNHTDDRNGDDDPNAPVGALLELLARNASKSPRSIVGDQEYIAMIREAFTDLPSDYQCVLRMRYVEQQEFPQIAQRLNRGQGAVRMLAFRALKHLRSLLPRVADSSVGGHGRV